jgi:serine phosphatase RsbU (regulator of sigma subunit)
VLGLFEEWDCAVGERQLRPGDLFVLYTDGVTESFNEAEEEFGEQRLVEACLMIVARCRRG